jgi:hypothetical protein
MFSTSFVIYLGAVVGTFVVYLWVMLKLRGVSSENTCIPKMSKGAKKLDLSKSKGLMVERDRLVAEMLLPENDCKRRDYLDRIAKLDEKLAGSKEKKLKLTG